MFKNVNSIKKLSNQKNPSTKEQRDKIAKKYNKIIRQHRE